MNVMKAFLLTAPAAAVLFAYVLHVQQEHRARLELESARFDREWAELQAGGGNKTFWEIRKKEAEVRENETALELEERKQKLKEFEREFDKAWNDSHETQNK
ncbi:MAG: hypothetical protein ABIM17_06125 [candidate division WOR-3 bacterium]